MDDHTVFRKLQALLHDPPEKPVILGKVGHEARAEALIKMLHPEGTITDEAKDADHIASAADRINFPKDIEAKISFDRDPVVVHPLSGKEFKIPASATSAVSGVDYVQTMKAVDQAFTRIAGAYDDVERRFLSVWGELLSLLKATETDLPGKKLGHLWELLPADTRVPDHSIWEHRRIASAFASALPEPALLIIALGPVQEFIATARKTQDLWAGSYLLAYLAWSAAQSISEEWGPDSIIFPDLLGQPFCRMWLREEKGLTLSPEVGKEDLTLPTLPNRLLAVLPCREAAAAAHRAEEAVRETFRAMCLAVKTGIEAKAEGLSQDPQWDAIWERQIDTVLEVYWVALPLGSKKEHIRLLDIHDNLFGKDSSKDFRALVEEYRQRGFEPNIGTVYEKSYVLIERALGARKATRDFGQHGEPHFKCSMCGLREPVHPEGFDGQTCSDYPGLRRFWRDGLRPLFPTIKATESLCAVCTTKRLLRELYFNGPKGWGLPLSYPSTSTVATAAFVLRLIEKGPDKVRLLAHAYSQKIEALVGRTAAFGSPLPMAARACHGDALRTDVVTLEGDWLYKESLDEMTLRKEYGQHVPEDQYRRGVREARETLRNLMQAIRESEQSGGPRLGKPSLYYAILQMDGDHMGRWLSGEEAPAVADALHPEVRKSLANDRTWKDLLSRKRPLTPSLHIAISRALRDFSLRVVREIVERDHLGKLIYAGGDDVLAFVSLRDLFDVMEKLRAYFNGALSVRDGELVLDFETGSGYVPVDLDGRPLNVGAKQDQLAGFLYSMGTTATASMGVAIVHHAFDLGRALQLARAAEKKAKRDLGRNAFAITLSKRSGGAVTFGSKWYYTRDEGSESFRVVPVLKTLVEAMARPDGISPRLAYDVGRAMPVLEGLPLGAFSAELNRLLLRHIAKQFPKERAESIAANLAALTGHLGDGARADIAELLNIAAFLSREENR